MIAEAVVLQFREVACQSSFLLATSASRFGGIAESYEDRLHYRIIDRLQEQRHTFWRCGFHSCPPIRTFTVFCIRPELTTTALSFRLAVFANFVADICSSYPYYHAYIGYRDKA